MSTFITLKSIAFSRRYFKVNICCVIYQPVTQHGPVSAQTRSINKYGLAEFSPFLLKSLLQFLQNLRRWLSTAQASIQIIPKCSIGFKSGDLDGQGALLRSDWLKSQQQYELCAADCYRADKFPYGGSLREACVVSKPHLCIQRRLGCRGCAPVEFFRRRIWHPTS